MKLVLDVETSVTRTPDGRIDNSPYNAGNRLVSVGFAPILASGRVGRVEYCYFYHNEITGVRSRVTSTRKLRRALKRATLLIGHNIKFDLSWIRESGFEYSNEVWDTMVAEYVLARGLKLPFNLFDSCVRRKVSQKKKDLVEGYWKQGVGFEAMPKAVVTEYGIGDIISTGELFIEQQSLFAEEENRGLLATVTMMNEFGDVLTDIQRNGIKIDFEALDYVEAQYQNEKVDLERRLQEMVFRIMGDTTINLNSSEQLSWVIYSRRVKNKAEWKALFNIGTDERGKPLRRPRMSQSSFAKAVRENCTTMRVTRAYQCRECHGTGKFWKTKKNGDRYAKPNICPECQGKGVLYEPLERIAGLKMQPKGVDWAAQGGFVTDKETLDELAEEARIKGNKLAEEFLTLMKRLNAVTVYLDSFVGGIRKNVGPDGILHCQFNLTATKTGRLSSSEPNFQNQPRGKTFPIRRVVVSRFAGGTIFEGDYAQLEFRVAAELSGCPNALADILAGVDAHQFTADTLTAAGQVTDRQTAKCSTFKPLYGGLSGTTAEVAYYTAFLQERYPRIGEWHIELQETVLANGKLVMPSGREYQWPGVRRLGFSTNKYMVASNSTQQKNWPVQGFATGDIVPLAVIQLHRLFQMHGLKSVVINTVHDSICADCYPGEEKIVLRLMRWAMMGVIAEMKRRWNYEFKVPLAIEIKGGPNWLDTEVVQEDEEDIKEAA